MQTCSSEKCFSHMWTVSFSICRFRFASVSWSLVIIFSISLCHFLGNTSFGVGSLTKLISFWYLEVPQFTITQFEQFNTVSKYSLNFPYLNVSEVLFCTFRGLGTSIFTLNNINKRNRRASKLGFFSYDYGKTYSTEWLWCT